VAGLIMKKKIIQQGSALIKELKASKIMPLVLNSLGIQFAIY
jgi:hypothetical protein